MLGIKAFSIGKDLCPVLQKKLDYGDGSMFAGKVEGNMVRVRDWVDASRLGQEPLNAI